MHLYLLINPTVCTKKQRNLQDIKTSFDTIQYSISSLFYRLKIYKISNWQTFIDIKYHYFGWKMILFNKWKGWVKFDNQNSVRYVKYFH